MKIKFSAKIPILVRYEKRVTKKRFETLPDNDRRKQYARWGSNRIDYIEILSPVLNKAVVNIEKKLKKYKVKYTKEIDGEFVVIKSL